MFHHLPFSPRPAALALTLVFAGTAIASDVQIGTEGDYLFTTNTAEEIGDPAQDLTISTLAGPAVTVIAPASGTQSLKINANNITLTSAVDGDRLSPGPNSLQTIRHVNEHYYQGIGLDSSLWLSGAGNMTLSAKGANMNRADTDLSVIRIINGSGSVLAMSRNVDVTAEADGLAAVRAIYNDGTKNVRLHAYENLAVTAIGNRYTAAVDADHHVGVDPEDRGGTVDLTADGDLRVLARTTGEGSRVYGIHAYEKNRVAVDGSSRVSITAEAAQNGEAVALFADGFSSKIEISAATGVSLLATANGNQLGLAAVNDGGSLDIISDGAENQIAGDIVNVNQGMSLLTLGGGSVTGRIVNAADNWTDTALVTAADDGLMLATFTNVNWQMTGNSDITVLISDGSVIENKGNSYNRLTLGAFDGNDNTFVLRADMQNEAADNPTLDVVEINELFPVDFDEPDKLISNTNKVKVVMVNAPGADSDKMHAENASIINNNSKLTMTLETEGGYVDGSTDRWVLRYADDAADLDAENPADTLGTTGGTGSWYLVRIRGAQDTAEGNMVQTLGTGLSGYLSYRNELAMLGDRLGSVRQTGDAGLWVRVSGDKAHARGASGLNFKQTDVSVTLGADGKVWEGGNRTVIAGAAFKAGRSNLDGAAAKADVNHYSLKGYATMMNANGAYVDAVLQTGVYTHDMTGRSNTGLQSVTGDYNTFGFGASLEAGHRFGLAKNFYAEPSIQLSWFHLKGRDYTLSTGMHAAAGSADFLTGRLGVTAGWEKTSGTANTESFSRQALALRTGVNRDFRAKQNVVTGDVTEKLNARGTSVYYGLEGSWTLGNTSLFAVVDREEGNKYRRDFGVKAGVRYQF